MTMSQTLITSRDPKGLHAVGLFEAVYNKSKLDEARAQRLNEHGGELQDGIAELIAELSVSNQYASEEVRSNYTYPKEYKGPKPISQQIDVLAKIFGFSLGFTSEFVEKVLPTLTLPDGAEGWFAIPSIDALASRFFPEVKDPKERLYCKAVNLVLAKIGESRTFYNYCEGQLTPDRFRLNARTAHALDLLAEQQKGDILIVAAQLGMRHRGKSVHRAREVFVANEFGLGAFAFGIMLLTHPEREVQWEQLHVDCAGDEFAPGADDGFSESPYFRFDGGWVEFNMSFVVNPSVFFGSVSGFLSQ